MPFDDFLRIRLPVLQAAKLTFFLYDALGRLVKSTGLDAFDTRLETADLPDGAYFWQVWTGGKRVSVGKAVKVGG